MWRQALALRQDRDAFSVARVDKPSQYDGFGYFYSPNSLLLGVLNALKNGRLGSRLACLPRPFICLPSWVLVVGFPAGLSPSSFHLSPTSFHLSPKLGACGRVPGWLVFHLSPLLLICLPGWVLVVGFPAGLSPTSLHLSPTFPPNSLLLGVLLNSFLRCPLCHCWCPPISTGHVAFQFLFIYLPGLSLLVSALFRWPYSFVSQVCHW